MYAIRSYYEIFKAAAHPYTRRLLECDPANIEEKTRQLPTIEGEIPNLVHLPQGCIFYDRCLEHMEICARQAPEPLAVGPGHWAACHLNKPLQEGRDG